jgi:hypothetical protein
METGHTQEHYGWCTAAAGGLVALLFALLAVRSPDPARGGAK